MTVRLAGKKTKRIRLPKYSNIFELVIFVIGSKGYTFRVTYQGPKIVEMSSQVGEVRSEASI